MLNIKIICVGKLKEKFYTDASKEYEKRLSGHCKLEILELPEYRLPSGYAIRGVTGHHGLAPGDCSTREENGRDTLVALALEKECSAIMDKLPAGALTAALCVEGQEMDSIELSEFLSECAIRSASRICFIIGGSFGLHDSIKNNADIRLSMSKMTFPHNLARIVLLEQIYRAFQISEGGKYHK